MNTLIIKLNISETLKDNIYTKLNNNNLQMETYILNLINKDINTKIYFKNGFYFDYNKNMLFNENNEIPLTKNQYKVFKYLLDNQNKLISYEELEEALNYCTKDSIRNFVSQLRIKIYKSLIETVHGNGFIMSINNNLIKELNAN